MAVAEIFVDPGRRTTTTPSEEIVATLLLELDHVTLAVMAPLEPSEYVPAAINSSEEPIARFNEPNGWITIDLSVRELGIDPVKGVVV
jgi:hypothetical protein